MIHPQHFPFTKMHGAGNDFILFDNRSLNLSNEQIEELTPRLSNRKFGVGSDGVIALEYDHTKEADLVMTYKNPDGSDAGMCGNGARCFAKYAVTLGAPPSFSFRVHDKVYRAETADNSAQIEFPLETSVEMITVGEEELLNVYTNTEHIVCTVSDRRALEDESALIQRGRFLRYHDHFKPVGTNVNFIVGEDSSSASLQTYERGVESLTLACGTGAIASALAWHHLQDAGNGSFRYQINVKGGTLTVYFTFSEQASTYTSIKLEGPTAFVFDGRFYL
jgi:diaminopimelate epimerase